MLMVGVPGGIDQVVQAMPGQATVCWYSEARRLIRRHLLLQAERRWYVRPCRRRSVVADHSSANQAGACGCVFCVSFQIMNRYASDLGNGQVDVVHDTITQRICTDAMIMQKNHPASGS